MRIFKIIVLTKLKEKKRQIFSRELETIKKYKMELLKVKRNNLPKLITHGIGLIELNTAEV